LPAEVVEQDTMELATTDRAVAEAEKQQTMVMPKPKQISMLVAIGGMPVQQDR